MKKRVYAPKDYVESAEVEELVKEYPYYDPMYGRYKVVEEDGEVEPEVKENATTPTTPTAPESIRKYRKQEEMKGWEGSFAVYKKVPKIIAWIILGLNILVGLILMIMAGDSGSELFTVAGLIVIGAGVGLYFFTKFILSVIIAPIVLQTEYQKAIHDEMLNKKD